MDNININININNTNNNINKNINSSEIDEEETISDSFICCVCLDLLYKPIVLDCGHVSCFWCVHKSMNGLRESHCPICRHSYHHFPTICEMLHFLLVKMYPVAYRRRDKQVFEEEKQMDCFSPQLDNKELMSSTPCEGKSLSEKDINASACIEVDNMSTLDNEGTCGKVSLNDVLCPACKQMLFRPAVLNCGHVYCEACIVFPDDGIIICKVCESPHPTDFPDACLELNNFLEETFPKEFAARKLVVEQKQSLFQHKNPAACSNSKKSSKNDIWKSPQTGEDAVPWWSEHGSKIHYGVGCDNCGVFPIVGDRYKCQDCEEKIGFDLCGDCYNTRSKRPGRFNQQHTPDHRFELVKKSELFKNIMSHLIGLHRVDDSGAPVLAISAIEDSPDGWVAIESAVADVLGPNGGEIDLDNNQEGHDTTSPAHHPEDTNPDQDQTSNLEQDRND